MHRFHIPPARWNPGALLLGENESRHCLEVLRCATGDTVVAFNGRGDEASTRIASTDQRNAVSLELIGLSKSPPVPCPITLGQAIPKGRNMDLIIQKATELGAANIAPLISERTIVRYNKADLERKRAKWRRTAIEACKQSGQNWLPDILPPQPLADFLASGNHWDFLLIASLEPDARDLKTLLAEFNSSTRSRPASALILIGPEGDFTPAEVNLAKSHNCQPLNLGPIVLRTETAALYALSILGHELR